jgi:hypothetical protein
MFTFFGFFAVADTGLQDRLEDGNVLITVNTT